jgi:hypothetical protein
MPLTQLRRTLWQTYFERLNRALGTERVQVEATGLALSDVTGWLALEGLAYDAEADAIALRVGGGELRLPGPRRIDIDAEDEWLHGIEIVDAQGHRHVLRLQAPLRGAAAVRPGATTDPATDPVALRAAIQRILDELGLQAFLFTRETKDGSSLLRVECATNGEWKTVTVPVDDAELLASVHDTPVRKRLCEAWRERLRDCTRAATTIDPSGR